MQAKKHQRLKVERKAIKIVGDTSRVITLLHLPGDRHRISKIIQRIMNLSETTAKNLIAQIMAGFSSRHENIGRRHRQPVAILQPGLPRQQPDTERLSPFEVALSCTLCQSFAPNHVCVVSPERLGLCGAYNWLDCKASYSINPTGPNQPIKLGKLVDFDKGYWEGTND